MREVWRVCALWAAVAVGTMVAPAVLGEEWEHKAIRWLQVHDWADRAMEAATHSGDPKTLFFRVSPAVMYAVDQQTGVQLLLGVAASDCLNAALKFVFRGDRPFWVYPDLRQFDMTCETGFGMPSGHVMVSTTVWVTLAWHLSPRVLGLLAALYLPLIAVSRVHIAAHFPSQVFAGWACGMLVSHVLVHIWPTVQQTLQSKPPRTRLTLVVCAVAALGVCLVGQFTLLSALFDPFASVALATNSCRIEGGVHSTTGPLVGLLRDCGVFLGAGLALALAPHSAFPPLPLRGRGGWLVPAAQRAFRVAVAYWGMDLLAAVARQWGRAASGATFLAQQLLSFWLFGFGMVLVLPMAILAVEGVVLPRLPGFPPKQS